MERASSPLTRMEPELGSTSRLTIRSSVVLPEPEVPTMAAMVPVSTVSVTSSTARSRP